jgi:ABC-2 type transport system ATP-binding protein
MHVRRLACLGLLTAGMALALIPATAGAYQIQDNQVATSFDGTPIVYTLFMPDNASATHTVPVIMRTHGWGGSRENTATGFVQQLLDNGYGVLTWDSRGFGQSGGMVEVDSPDFEARDASALIDVLQADPRVAKKKGDPLIGMSGGSYAGGIQWITAARDPRVDVIAPEISWHNLLQSLYPETVVKTGWGTLLYAAGLTAVTGGADPTDPAGPQTGIYDPQIHQAFVEGSTTGTFSQQTQDFFSHRGPDYLLGNVNVPTFIIQGTIDTLFPPDQGAKNYAAMKSLHPRLPLKMEWYCSGHGTCSPFNSGPANYTQDEIVKWFDRYLKGNKVDTGPKFEYITDDGVWHGATDYPVPATTTRSATGSGIISINGGVTATGLLPGSDAPASLQIPLPSQPGTLIGAPTVTLTENALGTATDEPNQATAFFQIVNKTKNEVLGNQITPKVFASDGLDHTYTFGIEPVSYTIDPGDQLVLEIASTSTSYEPYRGGAVVNFKNVQVNVPQLP